MNPLLFLEFQQGELIPRDSNINLLKSPVIMIILDELTHRVWMWLGADSPPLLKRMANRTAQTLKTYGYSLKGAQYSDFSEITTIDEALQGEPETQDLLDALKMRVQQDIEKVYPNNTELIAKIEAAESTANTESKIESDELIPAPDSEDLPVIPSSEELDIEAQQKGTPEIPVEIKKGILLAAILKEFPEVYISARSGNIVVENPKGTLTIFKVLERELELSPEFDFKGKQELVLQHYKTVLALLS